MLARILGQKPARTRASLAASSGRLVVVAIGTPSADSDGRGGAFVQGLAALERISGFGDVRAAAGGGPRREQHEARDEKRRAPVTAAQREIIGHFLRIAFAQPCERDMWREFPLVVREPHAVEDALVLGLQFGKR